MKTRFQKLMISCVFCLFTILIFYSFNRQALVGLRKYLIDMPFNYESDLVDVQLKLKEKGERKGEESSTRLSTQSTTTPKTIKKDDEKLSHQAFDELIPKYCSPDRIDNGYECLKQVSQFQIEADKYDNEMQIVYYHTFWKVNEGTNHERIMMLQILSFLATQDLKKARFIIWQQNSFSENLKQKLNAKLSFYLNNSIIQFRLLDFNELCSTDVFKKRYNECTSVQSYNPVMYSDFVRFLVLNKYGGIYVDGDVFFLRDMRPFWKKDFVHRWSFILDYNTAVMGLTLNRSEIVDNLYSTVMNGNNNLIYAFYPTQVKNILSILNKGSLFSFKDFMVYHSVLFDPTWLCNDGMVNRLDDKISCTFNEFYDKIITEAEFDVKKFYYGAFTYHLHYRTCGTCIVRPDSYFYQFENFFSKKIQNLGNS